MGLAACVLYGIKDTSKDCETNIQMISDKDGKLGRKVHVTMSVTWKLGGTASAS